MNESLWLEEEWKDPPQRIGERPLNLDNRLKKIGDREQVLPVQTNGKRNETRVKKKKKQRACKRQAILFSFPWSNTVKKKK